MCDGVETSHVQQVSCVMRAAHSHESPGYCEVDAGSLECFLPLLILLREPCRPLDGVLCRSPASRRESLGAHGVRRRGNDVVRRLRGRGYYA